MEANSLRIGFATGVIVGYSARPLQRSSYLKQVDLQGLMNVSM